MKKIITLIMVLFYLPNLVSQNWVNVVTSAQNFNYFYTGAVDTTSHTMYLGGFFNEINNIQTKGIVKYNGVNFDSLGSGLQYLSSLVQQPVSKCLQMFQNKLYVAGVFDKAGRYNLNNFARWNGTDWDSVNFKLNGSISSMIVHNNELYVAGIFDSIAGSKSYNIAKYDGTNWYNVGQSYSSVTAIENYNGVLYKVGGDSAGVSCSDLEYFNGSNWIPWSCVSGSITKSIWGIKKIDSMLYVYGKFDSIGGVSCRGLAAWNGSKWFGFNYGTTSGAFSNSFVRDISKINGNIYASGIADSISNTSSAGSGVAKYDGNKWCRFINPISGLAHFFLEFNDSLYFGGTNFIIGSTSFAKGLVKWIGGSSTLDCEPYVGINEVARVENLKIYPNPTTSIINIEDENNLLQNATINIENNLGQVVFTAPFTNQINLSHLSSGMYFLTIKEKSNKQTVKILKE